MSFTVSVIISYTFKVHKTFATEMLPADIQHSFLFIRFAIQFFIIDIKRAGPIASGSFQTVLKILMKM